MTTKNTILAVTLMLTAADASAQAAIAARVHPRAEEAMRAMSAFLAKTKSFTLEAEEAFDAEYARSYRVQLTNTRKITVERPSRFSTVAHGDVMDRASWYDGKTLTVLHPQSNTYASVAMPSTIDGVLDTLASEYSFALPLSDVLYSDPYTTLMADVLYGKYLGIHQAAGVPCHHLAFGQDGVEWQIWIDAGAQPLPRKLTIAYWDQPDVPQYRATFLRWDLAPKLAASQFQFVVPAGARKLEIQQFVDAVAASLGGAQR
jgi:hypothetical protein